MKGRTWGPFTGTQLTVMFVALMLVVAPGTLWAVAPYTNVAIQDPNSGKKTYVDAKRRLWVYNPLTSVTSADEVPGRFVRFYEGSPATQPACSKVASPPAGMALIIKTIVVDTWSRTGGGQIIFDISQACSGTVSTANPGSIGTTVIPLETGFVVPAGQSFWAIKDGSIEARVYGTGYLVPANWAPASASYDVSASPG